MQSKRVCLEILTYAEVTIPEHLKCVLAHLLSFEESWVVFLRSSRVFCVVAV